MKIFSSKYAVPCLIALAGLLAYSNTFHVPFQFDDEAYIVNNPAIRSFHYVFAPGDVGALPGQSPTSVPDALRVAFTTRIVGYASFAANYALHGLDVAGYHVFNLLVHILNGVLVFLLIEATLKTGRLADPAGTGRNRMREAMPAASALLFVCHPIPAPCVLMKLRGARGSRRAALRIQRPVPLFPLRRAAPSRPRRGSAPSVAQDLSSHIS